MASDLLISVAGAGLILVALRDVFHTLWHPVGRGSLSALVMGGVWRCRRRSGGQGRLAVAAGPAALVVVIAVWTSLVVVGGALVYAPHMPDDFSFAPGLAPSQREPLLDGLYLSLVTVATLGFGDIVPAEGWLRIAAPLQGLLGFALLTAAVSWVGQVYPALTRRRALALRLEAIRRSLGSGRLTDTTFTAVLLENLAAEVIRVRVDLSQRAETYYFHDGDGGPTMAALSSYAADLALAGQRSGAADVRTSATMLATALEEFASVLEERFLKASGGPWKSSPPTRTTTASRPSGREAGRRIARKAPPAARWS
ncbi:potassium channel family protein [Streptomyces sp. S063]|uniref:potassium channel family protein n=1 Tax=Streptomyces sp. S063 TaxID=2005885 RepID=UPI001F3708A1|nr:potassium channel family protein [Streptomyces sp. S063]